ncbi:MAG: hypothetical protein ISR64_05305 [Deltaproteobacteria bacterium]|nr:hypothetical protein [Deltaproteobacteria bacterium]
MIDPTSGRDVDHRVTTGGAWAGYLAVLAALSCGSAGDTCVQDLQPCDGGVCLAQHCEPLAGDADFDGLSNGDEITLGSNPLNWDTDDDERPDREEVGGDTANPVDTDGDGVFDVLESAVADGDKDCVPDQFDPANSGTDPPAEVVTLHNCARSGVCASGFGLIASTCQDGAATCDYGAVPGWSAEEDTCDGADNDCDVEVDEGFTLAGIPIGFQCDGKGVCGIGVVECAADGQSTRCSTDAGGSMDESHAETCDGLDNNCNGLTDDGLLYEGLDIGTACDGRGECGEGEVECGAYGEPICSTDATGSKDQSEPEVCNGLDDDCDGDTDDEAGVTGVPSEVCKPKGVCATHTDKTQLVCVDGKETCDYSQVPGYSGELESVCGGEDDDCDGLADEDFWLIDPAAGKVHVGEPCGTGACAGGTVVCAQNGTHATCSSLVASSPESCNQVDDDCDGTVDNDLAKVFTNEAILVSVGQPRPRAGAALVFHEPSGSLFMYGGAGKVEADLQVSLALSDFWRFDLQTHRFHVLEGNAPGPRSNATFIHDPAGSRLLLAGGLVGDDTEGPIWAYRLDEGTWAKIPVSILQEGTVGVALDPASWSLMLVRTDAQIPDGRMVKVALETLDVQTLNVDLPYRREAATAYRPDTGVLFVSGGFDLLGLPTDDLIAVNPDGSTWPVIEDGGLPHRARHAITALSDGSLLLVGGVSDDGIASDEVFRVWPDLGQAEPVIAAAQPGLQMPALSSVGLVAWLYSGMDQQGKGFRQVMRFDAQLVQWTLELLEVAPSGRAFGSMPVLNARKSAYFLGGVHQDVTSSHPTVDLWSYSLVGGAYKQLAMEGESPVFIHGATAVDETEEVIYLSGGYTGPPDEGGEATSKFLKFDPDEPIMENLSGPGSPSPRFGHSLVWTGSPGTLLLYGGASGEGVKGDVWFHGPDTGWADLQAVPHPRQGHRAFWDPVLGRMLVLGGSPESSLAAFDPVQRTWTVLAEHPLLQSPGGSAFFDRDSRRILFLPADGSTTALVLWVPESGAVQAAQLELVSAWPGAGTLNTYDPFGRRALIFGGQGSDGTTSSSVWEIPQFCP